MDAGEFRGQDARLLLLATYSTVIGVATEVEVLRALGIDPTARSLVRRRAELLAFLRSALRACLAAPPAWCYRPRAAAGAADALGRGVATVGGVDPTGAAASGRLPAAGGRPHPALRSAGVARLAADRPARPALSRWWPCADAG